MNAVIDHRAAESANARPVHGGQEVTIRPVLAGDGRMLQAFVRGLSPTSRNHRFHGGVNELSPELLKRFTNIDHSARDGAQLQQRRILAERSVSARRATAKWKRTRMVGSSQSSSPMRGNTPESVQGCCVS